MIDSSIPLCELHRHLDGSIRVETILDLARQHDIPLPADSVEGLTPFIHINGSTPGLMAFLEGFKYLVEVLVNEDACRRIAYENVQDAAREGINYIELRFSPWFMAQRYDLNPQAVTEACLEGARAGQDDFAVRTNLIGILSRTYGPEICSKELDALLACRQGLVAVDLAGDEAGFPPAMFVDHFRRVRDAGLHVTIHAGEADGPQSVWSAINDLGAERIGHGFRSIEDPALVEHLADTGTGLECCPTSNLHISAIERYADHPIARLAGQGVKFCLNTDDPGISAITLAHEYDIAAPAIGLSTEQIHQSQVDALSMAFLEDDERDELRLVGGEE